MFISTLFDAMLNTTINFQPVFVINGLIFWFLLRINDFYNFFFCWRIGNDKEELDVCWNLDIVDYNNQDEYFREQWEMQKRKPVGSSKLRLRFKLLTSYFGGSSTRFACRLIPEAHCLLISHRTQPLGNYSFNHNDFLRAPRFKHRTIQWRCCVIQNKSHGVEKSRLIE